MKIRCVARLIMAIFHQRSTGNPQLARQIWYEFFEGILKCYKISQRFRNGFPTTRTVQCPRYSWKGNRTNQIWAFIGCVIWDWNLHLTRWKAGSYINIIHTQNSTYRIKAPSAQNDGWVRGSRVNPVSIFFTSNKWKTHRICFTRQT